MTQSITPGCQYLRQHCHGTVDVTGGCSSGGVMMVEVVVVVLVTAVAVVVDVYVI